MREPREHCEGCQGSGLPTLDGERQPDGRCLLHVRRLPPRAVLFSEGDQATHAWVIRSGALRTYRVFSDGRFQGLRLLGPGAIAGIDCLARGRHVVTAQAVTESIVCSISVDRLRRVGAKRPDLWPEVCAHLCAEVDALHARMRDLGIRRSERKVASFLASLADGRGGAPVGVRQRDIAEFLGMTPETVSRAFASLRRRGLVGTGRPRRGGPELKKYLEEA